MKQDFNSFCGAARDLNEYIEQNKTTVASNQFFELASDLERSANALFTALSNSMDRLSYLMEKGKKSGIMEQELPKLEDRYRLLYVMLNMLELLNILDGIYVSKQQDTRRMICLRYAKGVVPLMSGVKRVPDWMNDERTLRYALAPMRCISHTALYLTVRELVTEIRGIDRETEKELQKYLQYFGSVIRYCGRFD